MTPRRPSRVWGDGTPKEADDPAATQPGSGCLLEGRLVAPLVGGDKVGERWVLPTSGFGGLDPRRPDTPFSPPLPFPPVEPLAP